MEKSQYEILVMEDDETQAAAIKEALKRQGYSVTVEKDPDRAISNSKFKNYNLAIVDCMLPKQNGVDVAKKLYRDSHNEMATIFVSGVFKDPKFIETTVESVNAAKFFTKPFNMEEVVASVNNEYDKIAETEHLTAIHNLMTKPENSNQDKVNAVNNSNTLHGLDLPNIYTLFSSSNLSGVLTIKYSERRVYKVYFSEGHISKVESKDRDSFFGTLLVEYGFATLKDVKRSLANQEHKKLGEKLIDSNAMSPHAIKIVYKEQLYIRLSKSIQNRFIDIHFEDKSVPLEEVFIDKSELYNQQSDWILSKMQPSWLDGYFNNFLDYRLVKGPRFNDFDQWKDLPVLEPIPDIRKVLDFASLQDFMNNTREDYLHHCGLYFLLINKVIIIDKVKSNKNALKLRKLQKIWKDISGKNYFEILSVKPTSPSSKISKAYQELAVSLHPDKLSPTTPREVRELTEKIFSKITEAYTNLKNDASRAEYLKDLEIDQFEDQLKLEGEMDKGIKLLKGRDYRAALEIFHKISDSNHPPNDINIYLAWALLKLGCKPKEFEEYMKNVHAIINKVPHEERHNPEYLFIKGLFYYKTGNRDKAYKNYKNALALNHTFIEARRELNKVTGPKKNQSSIFNVSKIFKK